MPTANHVTANSGDLLVLAGTTKGAFVLRSDSQRRDWEVGGPYFPGRAIYALLYDNRKGRNRLCSNVKRLFVAISTGGVYRTDDGGENWQPRNVGVRAQFLPPDQQYPEWGQCVHKIVSHPANPQRMFLQNHWGLYRSDDGGDSWTDIANGVPSDFGFAMEIDHHDPNSAYIIPLESDEFRCTPEAKLRVYRTSNAGESWQPQTNGLPQENAFETILRDGMAGDTLQPMGLYFGTRNGKVFGSADCGESWDTIAEGLPPVVCVKTAVIN